MAVKKVLVIDDNPVVIKLDEALLKSAGYDVVSALDGEDGLRKARAEQPDVILLDVILPRIHGFELCQRLKQDPETKRIAVIIVTGTGLDDVARNEPGIMADGYLSKPYGFKELEEAIIKAACAAGS